MSASSFLGGRFGLGTSVFAFFLLTSGPVLGQRQARYVGTNSARADSPAPQRSAISELSIENDNRVAASAAEIKNALVGNPGLMVELKRLIAMEASERGQIVNDDDLTNEAVYDRLEWDLKFRATATRLLQRYGYLLPEVNPQSEAGKEQDLVLKERARHLVQAESQGESGSSQRKRIERASDAQEACVQQYDPACSEQARGTPSLTNATGQGSGPEAPSPERQDTPEQPISRPSGSQAIQTGSYPEGYDGMLLGGSLPLTAISDSPRTALNQLSNGNSSNGLLDNPPSYLQPPSGSSPDLSTSLLPLSRNREAADQDSRRAEELQPSSIFRSGADRYSTISARLSPPPVEMVHRPNPYSDIPSLYDLYVQAASRNVPPKRFGAAVFQDGLRDPRAIPMDIPVNADYVVGPGDVLSIDLWGGVSSRLVRSVDREGRVNLPEAGPLQVSGKSLGVVQQAVERAIATQFRDTSADVSVSRLRTVRVYIVGEVAEPGAYDISSLSTALNALVAAGGVTARGSLRELKHYRGRQLIESIDAYDLLLRGVTPDARKLENGDTLRVPPIGPQVTVTGMVRRPAIYELNGENTLADVLDLAGGILPAAALKHVEVQRVAAHEKRTMLSLDLSADNRNSAQLASFKVQDGDEIHIFPIAPYNQDAIYLQGHVLRPGKYSYKKGMTFRDLITSYEDLLPEPAAHYAEIVRLNPPDFHPAIESFDLAAALANPAAAPKLDPLDTVRIFSRFDFEPAPRVWVGGEVRNPGQYVTSGQAHLRDAIFLAGGLTPDASLGDAQLFRHESDGNLKILSVNLHAALAGNPIDNVLLEPRDRLLIHRAIERVDPPTVNIEGQVTNPGRYPLTGNMRVADLIRVAGGLKRGADTTAADLTHYPLGGQPGEHLSVSLSAVLNGNETEDLALRNGDTLTIKQVPGWMDIGASISLRGEVQHPGSYGVQPGERLSSVLERAGGYTSEAYPYGAILMRKSVREIEDKQRAELVHRVEAQRANIKLLPENDVDQKSAKMNAVAQTDTALAQLQASPPVGRLVIHIQDPIEKWRNTQSDIAVRDGDVLIVPKKTGYVMVTGQVFNPTAVSYRGGRSAKWYLGQAGGFSPLADKKGIFVIRGDGSVISSRRTSGWFAGDPLDAALRPGDTVVVPEKALNVGNRNWTALLQTAQIASSLALTVAYFHP